MEAERESRLITAATVRRLAWECGFELAGVTPAVPLPEASLFGRWVSAGMAGSMSYLIDKKADTRSDPRALLPSARSVICVGKLYNGPQPYSTRFDSAQLAWISRYAWGDDYHPLIRRGLENMARKLLSASGVEFEWKSCVDTAPLLERAYARRAGLGWIGKNTCLINQYAGSLFFLGELLVSLDLDAGSPPSDRCGSCTRCIEACPTKAIVPSGVAGGPEYMLDSRLCISYLTIELRDSIPDDLRPGIGRHVFGCDICQDVCPWNRKAAVTLEPAFSATCLAPRLEELAGITEEEFRRMYGRSPVARARYRGFLRNVAVAMGNSGLQKFRDPLEKLAMHPDAMVADHARWALARLRQR